MTERSEQRAHIPRATYRLQLTPDFGFAEARRLIPYLQQLGISDVYCSPILTARAGSTHGYDVIDPLHINPELGGQQEFERLADEVKRHDMYLLIDIVPNHMAASIDNPWWRDVLENGPSSRFAHFFDIEWDPADPNESLHNRVLLPILGAPYGEALENGEIRLEATDRDYELRYFEHRLPVALEALGLIIWASGREIGSIFGHEPGDWMRMRQLLAALDQLPLRDHFDENVARRRSRLRDQFASTLSRLRARPEAARALERGLATINGVSGDPRSFDRLDRIVRRQPYRLAFWQIAREQINYRRFFDINDLVSLRVEDDDVFEATHQHILELVRSGAVRGLRIDHIDGLHDPERYLRTLRRRVDEASGEDPPAIYLIVEKILAFAEPLPENWPVSGTTGYDALNLIGDLAVNAGPLPVIDAVYRRLSGITDRFDDIVHRAKRQLLESTFAAHVRALSFDLEALSNGDRHGRDLTFDALQQALIEATAALTVYRTYTNSGTVGEHDRSRIEQSIGDALTRRPDLHHELRFLQRVLLLDIPGYVSSARRSAWLDFVMRWQQLCGPAMAKGNEDTALYRFFPLSSRNEVGGHPGSPPVTIDEAHTRMKQSAERWPNTIIATSTHDSKRSEDVRARIAVLSELPLEWNDQITQWHALNQHNRVTRDGRSIPDGNIEYLIYQTMLGAWPLDQNEKERFRERLQSYVIKAVREAKEHSSWVEPDAEYEDALAGFVEALFDPTNSHSFLSEFRAYQPRIAKIGALNSLSQTLIKLTAPGIPDIYQGCELWDFSLVDPDNRRPVDYPLRIQALEDMHSNISRRALLHTLTSSWQDGRIKLYLIQLALKLRQRFPDLFAAGDYLAVPATGAHATNVFSYVRTHETACLLAAAPRLFSDVMDDGDGVTAARRWGDTALPLPGVWSGTVYDLLSGELIPTVNVRGVPSLLMSDVLRYAPVGLVGNDRTITASTSDQGRTGR